ncbi:hypothetical protein LDENG_00158580 [Lucifuga dentata]|nr:hypothetical protein LDENG_00158580 [Lucifuga dentata]
MEGLERRAADQGPGGGQPCWGRGQPSSGRKESRAAPGPACGSQGLPGPRSVRHTAGVPNLGPDRCWVNLTERLPSETLMKILSYLDASSLICISHVNTRFHQLASDNVLWKDIYMSEFWRSYMWTPELKKEEMLRAEQKEVVQKEVEQKEQEQKEAELKDHTAGYWKKLYLKSVFGHEVNRWRKELRDISPYTGLPSQTERVLRPGWRSLLVKRPVATRGCWFVGGDHLINVFFLLPGFIVAVWKQGWSAWLLLRAPGRRSCGGLEDVVWDPGRFLGLSARVPQSVLVSFKDEGQGLVHPASRGRSFRLQLIQRILSGPADLVGRPAAQRSWLSGGSGTGGVLVFSGPEKPKPGDLPGLPGVFKMWGLLKRTDETFSCFMDFKGSRGVWTRFNVGRALVLRRLLTLEHVVDLDQTWPTLLLRVSSVRLVRKMLTGCRDQLLYRLSSW